MIRVRKSPREAIIKLMNSILAGMRISRSEVAGVVDITYWSARYWLEKLAEERVIRKEIIPISPKARRIYYYRIISVYLYRTQYSLCFYTEIPRTKTPDPIAEFRVTVVSDRKEQYDLEEFKMACIYIGVTLAPQTYWIKQETIVTADELDEPIDPDELSWSVPAKKKLNYAERYAIFFKSKQGEDHWWRKEAPYYWADPLAKLPAPGSGDYEYGEDFIKALEMKKVALGILKMKFNNERGEMESVET